MYMNFSQSLTSVTTTLKEESVLLIYKKINYQIIVFVYTVMVHGFQPITVYGASCLLYKYH